MEPNEGYVPPGVVELTVTGRITAEAIDGIAERLGPAVDSGSCFAVLFDRSAMTAFTEDGRAALDTWWERVQPAVEDRCAGWADLYDERRAAALRDHARAGESAYPHEVFSDRAEATAWLAERLAARTGAVA